MIKISSNKIYEPVRVTSLVLLLVCILGACVKLERPTLDRKYFTLDAVRPAVSEKKVLIDKNLIIRRVKISPRYEDRDLVYKTGANVFEADYYNAFFVPPSAMITQELRVWMGDSKVFANVLGPESMGTGDYLLEGLVNSIYGDYSTPDHKAALRMQFILIDNGDPDLPILYSHNFSREIPVQAIGPEALVKALNVGLESIFSELEQGLAEVAQQKKAE